ncbi:MAG: Holliday junction resolvase [Treponema sp.]|nr:Holliday junction resolvase [Treponema sp.]
MNQNITIFKNSLSDSQLHSFLLVLLFFIIVVIICSILTGVLIGKLVAKVSVSKMLKKEREDAVKRSKAVLGGQLAEQVAPFLPGFPCNPGDVRFIGKPVDFIAFPGMSQGKSVDEVVLIEVKTGTSTLSAREREIQKAVNEGRVSYKIFSFSSDNSAR